MSTHTKLDYTLKTTTERLALVNKILTETPNPSSFYLEKLADYLLISFDKERKLINKNKEATIHSRETSYDNLIETFENGEAGVAQLIRNDKSIIFKPAKKITAQDIETIPFLKQLREAIKTLETLFSRAEGHDRYILKSALIEARKDQYVIKNAFLRPISPKKVTFSRKINYFDDSLSLSSSDYLTFSGASFCNTNLITLILCNYIGLQKAAENDFEGDLWYLMLDFQELLSKALKDRPFYKEVAALKIMGKTNKEIQDHFLAQGVSHRTEHYSNIWRQAIPKLIASTAKREALIFLWQRSKDKPYKICSKCRKKLPAHAIFFSRNTDGFYSICKDCRGGNK